MITVQNNHPNEAFNKQRARVPLPVNKRNSVPKIPNYSLNEQTKTYEKECTYTVQNPSEVETFENISEEKGILNFVCENSPLNENIYTPIMAAMFFGPSLQAVNGKQIGKKQLQIAKFLSEELRPLLLQGWVIVKLEPITLLHVATKERETILKYNLKELDLLPQTNQNQPPKSPVGSGPRKPFGESAKLPVVHRRSRSRTNSFKQTSHPMQLDPIKESQQLSLKEGRRHSSHDLLETGMPKPMTYHELNESFASKRITFEEFQKLKRKK